MPKIGWNPDWTTGNEEIDGHHRELLETLGNLLDSLSQGGPESGTAPEGLARIAGYIEEHMHAEERLMLETGYPGYVAHKAMHDHLRAVALNMLRAAPGFLDQLPVELTRFLLEWFTKHLSGPERDFAEFMRSRR